MSSGSWAASSGRLPSVRSCLRPEPPRRWASIQAILPREGAASMADPKWLILVDRQHPELYEVLRRALREEPSVKVAWERRARSSPPRAGAAPERRRAPQGVAAGLVAVARPPDAGAGVPPSREATRPGTL